MARLKEWTEILREDVNREDSVLISTFGKITNFLLKPPFC